MNATEKRAADFGQRLKAAREDKGWTQVKLAKESKIPLNMIRMYEQGRSFPSVERVSRLCALLEVPIDQLIPIDWTDR